MPLIIPEKLPAADLLEKENIFVMHEARAASQDIRPLKLLMVNLMEDKAIAETQIARLLANTPIQVELTLIKLGRTESTCGLNDYMNTFYKELADIETQKFDGMIMSGAAIESYEFEEIPYWDEFCDLLLFAQKNVYSSFYIGYSAHAALYQNFKIPSVPTDRILGVYEHILKRTHSPLVRGFDDVFFAPHTQLAKLDSGAIESCKELRVLASSKEAGEYLIQTDGGKEIFVLGHPEYDRETLGLEYFKHLRQGEDIEIPKNYFQEGTKDVMVRWRGHGSMLLSNWLNYYVYQETPYDLQSI
ncbi:MAG: homoserine O-succinyltransferase [Eubacteriales bacterium]